MAFQCVPLKSSVNLTRSSYISRAMCLDSLFQFRFFVEILAVLIAGLGKDLFGTSTTSYILLSP